jgi:hypothetical protein
MIRATPPPLNAASERASLRRRVGRMYDWFDRGLWEKCFSLIDPRLREGSRADLRLYEERMRAFKEAYGSVHLWHMRINLHLDASASRGDKRPFAYVYIVWQDDSHGFHMFRERWVKDSGRWFTRVVGLVANEQVFHA